MVAWLSREDQTFIFWGNNYNIYHNKSSVNKSSVTLPVLVVMAFLVPAKEKGNKQNLN